MNERDFISIAVLTANQDDVALINKTLRDGGLAAHCHWVPQPGKLDDLLNNRQVELFILNCDSYADSIAAVIRQKDRFNPEIPVIAIQQQVDENSIQEAMRQGACDLASIGLNTRLRSIVDRELRSLRLERALNSTMQSARTYKRQLKDQMDISSNAMAICQEGILIDANDAWLQVQKAASRDELLGMPFMDGFDPESHAALKGALIATLAGKWQAEEKLKVKSALDSNDLELMFCRIDSDDGPSVQVRIAQAPGNSAEPTKLVHDALKRDPTTLFYHRLQFLERITKRLKKKPQSGTHALVFVRPDKFNVIQEKVGVIDSEEVLALFAEEIRKHMHPRDVAGRFEGTGIMLLLERGSARDAQVWGQKLIEHMNSRTIDIGDHSLQISCSVGACGVSELFNSLEEFVAATLAAHKLARKAGGNVSMLNEQTDENTKQREFDQIWVRHLKSALMDNRFRLAQLPIAGLRTDAIEMYDLLVRMIDEQGNSVLPSEFMPAAERNNMMKHIDRWMFKAAMSFCKKSNADRVFVRMSRGSIIDPSIMRWMEREFDSINFDCSRLVIQITEFDAAKHIKQTRAIVSQARKLGIGFALEHFGTENGGFRILDMLKPDYLKIDGGLMHTVITDTTTQEQVEAIVAEAATRNIKTIAERVENANAMAVLFQLGLDFMQGHYVQEPEVVLQDNDSRVERTLEELSGINVAGM